MGKNWPISLAEELQITYRALPPSSRQSKTPHSLSMGYTEEHLSKEYSMESGVGGRSLSGEAWQSPPQPSDQDEYQQQ